MGPGGWGPTPQPPTPNPQSPIPKSPFFIDFKNIKNVIEFNNIPYQNLLFKYLKDI
jgi:hypothetical protein